MKKLLIILYMIASLTTAVAAERVPGTKVSLTPPDNFKVSAQFPGYIMQETGSSIMVTEIPGPFGEIIKGFNKESLGSKGMKLIDEKDIKLHGRDAVLLNVSQHAYGRLFLKWIVAFGDESESILIIATFPKALEKEMSRPLKASVLSVKWDKTAEVDFLEGLTFYVSEEGRLKISRKMGNNIFLTLNGVFPLRSRNDPFVIVGSSMSEGWRVPDRENYAKERLKKHGSLKKCENFKGRNHTD